MVVRDGAVCWLILTDVQGNEVARTCVDAEDLERALTHRWSRSRGRKGKAYAVAADGTYLHRLLLDAPENLEVDHIDNDGLNNRRSNVRLATRQENAANVAVGGRESLRGVKYNRMAAPEHRWQAQVSVGGRTVYGGLYPTRDEARAAASALREELLPFSNEDRHR